MKITKLEDRLLRWASSHISALILVAVSLVGIGLRVPLGNIQSGDARFFLLPWYDQIKEAGGLLALDTQVGNYNLAYQTLIALLTYLPMQPLHAYKLLSCIFDYALAAAAGCIAWQLAPRRRTDAAVLAYSLVLLSPVVWLNSAAWAQCDAIYAFFALSAFGLLHRQRYTGAFVCLGFSFAFKLQAVFALPFFLVAWFRKRSFSLVNFLWIPGVLLLSGLPAILLGRNPLDVFTIYFQQVGEYPQLFLNYPSFWALLDGRCQAELYPALQGAALFLTMGLLLTVAWLWLRNCRACTAQQLLGLFFLLNYTCVLFLPAMHERYGYVYEVAAILLAVTSGKGWGLLAGLIGLSTMTYCSFLFGWQAISMPVMALANCGLYVLYMRRLLKPAACADRKAGTAHALR